MVGHGTPCTSSAPLFRLNHSKSLVDGTLLLVSLIRFFMRFMFFCNYLSLLSLFLGEALLVTGGLVLYFGDMLACTIVKVSAVLPG
jgi:hypothetical protein